MKRWSCGSAVIAFAALSVPMAGPFLAAAGGRTTTGDLALQLVGAAGITLPEDGSQRAALASLRKAGIEMGNDPGAIATEKVLVEVGRALGVKVMSTHPEAPVTPAMCVTFVLAVRAEARSAAARSGQANSVTGNASCQGRESRADRQGTPASTADPSATDEPCEPEAGS